MKHLDFFKNRYTVRRYSDKPLSDETLRNMIEAAAQAPNTGNMQWYSVVVTRDAERRAKLAPAHFNQPSVSDCAAMLTFCVDLYRFEQWCRISRAEPGFDNLQSFTAALIDTVIFAQQFCTIAELSGLGTCYLGTTAYNAPQIAEVLELPERVVPVIAVTVGYPLVEGNRSVRLPVEAVMHSETYRKMDDGEVAAAYEAIDNAPDSARFIAENGKETLAQVFTDVRYPRESAEYFSKVYRDFVIANGFNSPQ